MMGGSDGESSLGSCSRTLVLYVPKSNYQVVLTEQLGINMEQKLKSSFPHGHSVHY
jgi:hypothetical protein